MGLKPGDGGSYCLQLKGNQGDMKADARAFIDDQETDYIDEYTSTDADHDRVETRCTRVYTAPKYPDDTHKGPSLKAFVDVISTRELNGKSRQSERVYLMSNCPSARKAPINFAAPRRIALNIIKANTDANTDKGSNRVKFKRAAWRAGWNDDFLPTPLKDF